MLETTATSNKPDKLSSGKDIDGENPEKEDEEEALAFLFFFFSLCAAN